MAEPLTKHDAQGTRYTRPGTIDADIDTALALDLAALRARLLVAAADAADYLRSEALVHLVRRARRSGDQTLIGAVLPVLLGRCEAILRERIRDHQMPDAESVREEVLGAFSELFAADGIGDRPDELDYYECRFNLAFRTFRIDFVRSEIVRIRPIVSLPDARDDGEPEADEEVFAQLSETFRSPATQEAAAIWAEWAEAIERLPPDERDAVVLVHVLGYQEESKDPSVETAATRCRCTGKTIRNRLTRAAAKLSRFKETP